jgi:hypothetical protein
VNDLVDKLEEWLTSIDVFGSHQGRFAKAIIEYLLGTSLIPRNRPKEIGIIQDFLLDRTGRTWLNAEERSLVRMYKNPRISTGYISRELGRSRRSIYSKARRLGLRRPPDAMTDAKWKRMTKDIETTT